MFPMKRVVTIQDISCIGKCSLTVALPILSASRLETAVLPTALLSTHTAFSHFHFHDLSSDITPITDVWKKEGFSFDCIYTGYLGSTEEVDLVLSFIDDFKKKDTLVIVDPAMADHGRMYSGFDISFAYHMSRLCSKADIILPNMTEAFFLLGKEYKPLQDEEGIKSLLKELSMLGKGKVVLKGIELKGKEDKMGIAAYDKSDGSLSWYFHEKVDEIFHGTGDVFASAFTSAMMNGVSFEKSYPLAGEYVVRSIKKTMEEPGYHTYGVDFEKALPWLMKELKLL